MSDKVKALELALRNVTEKYEKISLSSSLGAEDMVLLHVIAKNNFPIDVFTLDTGRLHEETYKLMDEIQEKYDRPLTVYFPESQAIETLVKEQGINAFYRSIDARKSCCRIRKIEPLKRALQGQDVWVSGLRRDQSVTRLLVEEFSWEASFSLYKLNPLLDWSSKEVFSFINENDVPYNALHDRGFPSIGCSPCTRAITVGEDERAGRWWWEHADTKECGLHVKVESIENSPRKIVA